MGFMGTADGSRIKATANCKGSAELLWGGKETTQQQCKYARTIGSFCFKSRVARET